MPIGNIWTDINSRSGKGRSGWTTEKPDQLYQRILQASSDRGDLVLDPFCGCATTCIAAEALERRWIGIDIDPVAEKVTRNKLQEYAGVFQRVDGEFLKVEKSPPKRTDGKPVNRKEIKRDLWLAQRKMCANPYCPDKEAMELRFMHLDHKFPESRGGQTARPNLQVLCGPCNIKKGKKTWRRFLDEERMKQPHPKI